MPLIRAIASILIILLGFVAHAQELKDGQNLRPQTLQDVADRVAPGTILVLGEAHDNAVHSAQHVALLQELRGRGLKVSVGMEFLEYPAQDALDRYLRGELAEADFLKEAGWGGSNFAYYREQIRFSLGGEGWTYALNSPRVLSSKIARGGLESLSAEEYALLPPQFSRGNDGYFERFQNAMGGHGPKGDALERYFLAQSLWDDTMAWKALKALRRDPAQVLVIIVGEFHVQYGGGLPDRLRARGANAVVTLSQLNVEGASAEEIEEATRPTGVYGPRADFLWISRF